MTGVDFFFHGRYWLNVVDGGVLRVWCKVGDVFLECGSIPLERS